MLGIGLGAIWGRLLRADMIIALQSDSVIMARAKGISPNRVLWVHALRMSVLSLMTSVALQMAALLGGAVVAEQFFGPKGIGDRLIFAVQQNDLLVIQAIAADRHRVRRLRQPRRRPAVRRGRPADPPRQVARLMSDDPRHRSATAHRRSSRRPRSRCASAAAGPDARRDVRRGVARRAGRSSPSSPTTCRSSAATTSASTGAGNYAFGPGADFWFGSDRLGRDVFARCIYGARITLIIGITSIVIGMVVGTTLGMIAGYRRGWARPGDLDHHRRPAGVPGAHLRHCSSSAAAASCGRATSRSSASASAG